MTTVAPSPEALDALVAHELHAICNLACLHELLDIGGNPEAHQEYIRQQLDVLSVFTRAFGEDLVLRAMSGERNEQTEDQLQSALRDCSFPHWLHFVTRKLAPQAQAAVIPEVWEHYLSAVEQLDKEGAEDFYGRALQHMGPRKQVARRLERVHLTQSDMKMAQVRHPRWVHGGMICFWLLMLVVWELLLAESRNPVFHLGLILLIGTGIASLLLSFRPIVPGDIRKDTVVWGISQLWIATLMVWLLGQNYGLKIVVVLCAAVLFNAAGLWWIDAKLQRKMQLAATYPPPAPDHK